MKWGDNWKSDMGHNDFVGFPLVGGKCPGRNNHCNE